MKTLAKVLAVLTALAMLLSLAACGDAKDAKEETAAAATEAVTEAATEAGEAEGSPLIGTWSNKEYGTAYTFNTDGTGLLIGEGYKMPFTFEDQGDHVDIMYTAATKVQNVDYTIDGDTLTLADIEYTK